VRIWAVAFALAMACDDERENEPEPAPRPVADVVSEGGAEADEADEADGIVEADEAEFVLGYEEPTPLPTEEVHRLNREALAAHAEGRYEESLEGFEAALALEPRYDAVRFNRACALARLGRLGEARRVMRALLVRDLPSFEARLDDEDLAPLRRELEVFAAETKARYEASLEDGTPLVAYFERRARGVPVHAAAQSVLRLADGRILPLGPRVERRARDGAAVAVFADLVRRRTVAVGWRANLTEDPHMARVVVEVHPLFEGSEAARASGPPPEDLPYADVWSDADGVFVESGAYEDERRLWRVERDRTRRQRGTRRPSAPGVRVGQSSWAPLGGASWRVQGNRVVTPEGEVALGAGHAALRRHEVRVDDTRSVAVVLSSRSGYCGVVDRFVLDVVDVAAGTSRRLLAQEGQALVAFGLDGALYVQLAASGLRRYGEPKTSDAYDALPAWLGLSSAPLDVNPHC